MSFLARIVSLLYGLATSIRGWMYDWKLLRSYGSPIPVISVGNVTAGGNGKTPLCMLLVDEFRKRGYRPAVLSRGYGGKLKGPHRVTVNDAPSEVGDEPVLMASAGIPVFVSRSRVRGMKMIEAQGDFNLVVLDDGFQHRALRRNVDIVSIFAGSERAIRDFVRGALLPAGLFRERRDSALKRASMVVISYRSIIESEEVPPIDPRLLRLLSSTSPVYRSHLKFAGVVSLLDGSSVDPQSVCALAAIANPEGFFDSLEREGFTLEARFTFADHHQFTEGDLESLLKQHPNSLFVCTSKDAVKLKAFSKQVLERIAVLRVTAHVMPSDAFFTQVERLLHRSV